MNDGISGYVWANIARMRGPGRRLLPVLFLSMGFEVVPTSCRDEYRILCVGDRDAVNQARDILKRDGWQEYRVPPQFENVALSLSPPTNGSDTDSSSGRGDCDTDGVDGSSNAGDPMISATETSSVSSSERDGGISFAPNIVALEILNQLRERRKNRRETDPSRTQELIREARAGGMYGHESTE